MIWRYAGKGRFIAYKQLCCYRESPWHLRRCLCSVLDLKFLFSSIFEIVSAELAESYSVFSDSDFEVRIAYLSTSVIAK